MGCKTTLESLPNRKQKPSKNSEFWLLWPISLSPAGSLLLWALWKFQEVLFRGTLWRTASGSGGGGGGAVRGLSQPCLAGLRVMWARALEGVLESAVAGPLHRLLVNSGKSGRTGG